MAGDWLKVEHDTPDKPEVMGIAARLGCSLGDAFLGCFRAWRWADTQTRDGNAASVTEALLDSYIGIKGFAQAMLEVGWLEKAGPGLRFPNFERHISQSAKSRALTKRRVVRARQREPPKCNAAGVTKRATRALPREEKRESKKNTPPPPPEIPACLDTPEFRAAWDRWLKYRRGRRLTLRAETIQEQLVFLAGLGPAGALASLGDSIRCGWIGLFPPKGDRNGTRADLFAGQRDFVNGGPKSEP